MPRVPRTTDFRGAAKPAPVPAPAEDAPGAALLASLGPEKPKRKRTPSDAKRNLAKALGELDDVIAKRRQAEPRHLVALYAHAHRETYGVPPEELNRPEEYMGAVSGARSLVAQAFDGDIWKAIEFMRWVWQEQRGLTKWKRANDVPIKRVGWRLQFVSRSLVTDYRAAMFEKGERGPRR